MIIHGPDPLTVGKIHRQYSIFDKASNTKKIISFLVIRQSNREEFINYLKEENKLHLLNFNLDIGPYFYEISID